MDFTHQRSWKGKGRFFPKRNGRKSTVCFPLHIQSLSLDPESSLREDRQSTFLEAPGQKLACGVPTFLSCWGRQVERLVGPTGTSAAPAAAAAAAALESPRCWCFVCVSARCPAVLQNSRLEESLCEGGPGRFLWICSGLFPGRDSGGDRRHHERLGTTLKTSTRNWTHETHHHKPKVNFRFFS